MRDNRVVVFRRSLEELVESLDATVRLARWDGAETVPEPLRESASKLVSRLGAADRLAAGVFKGTTADMTRVSAMTDAMRRLETAYVTYRKKLDSVSSDPGKAAEDLVTTLDQVKSESFEPS